MRDGKPQVGTRARAVYRLPYPCALEVFGVHAPRQQPRGVGWWARIECRAE
jgi:hypothetical protein